MIFMNPHRLLFNFSPYNTQSQRSRYYYVTLITLEINDISFYSTFKSD